MSNQKQTASCQWIRTKLSAFLDNELDASTRQKIARHLEDCPSCRGELQEEQRLATLLGTYCDESLPEGLQTKILNKIHHHQKRRWWLFNIPVAASIAIAFWLGMFFSDLNTGSDHSYTDYSLGESAYVYVVDMEADQ